MLDMIAVELTSVRRGAEGLDDGYLASKSFVGWPR